MQRNIWRLQLSPLRMRNGIFMHRDFWFFFFLISEHCWQGSKYQAKIPTELSDTEPFSFLFPFFENESGLWAEPACLGIRALVLMESAPVFTLRYTSLPTFCGKTGKFRWLVSVFPVPASPCRKEVLLQPYCAFITEELIKTQNPRPHPQRGPWSLHF